MMRATLLCSLLIVSAAGAQPRPATKPAPVVARIIDFEIHGDARIVTVLAGQDQGIGKTWRARFIAGTSKDRLPSDEPVVIRIDKRTTVLKTKLTAAQIRANRFVQLTP